MSASSFVLHSRNTSGAPGSSAAWAVEHGGQRLVSDLHRVARRLGLGERVSDDDGDRRALVANLLDGQAAEFHRARAHHRRIEEVGDYADVV
jgi:hypothetical protein